MKPGLKVKTGQQGWVCGKRRGNESGPESKTRKQSWARGKRQCSGNRSVRMDWLPEVRRDNGTGSVGSGEETVGESVTIQADDSDDDVNLPTARV